jgi:hypothetical protein
MKTMIIACVLFALIVPCHITPGQLKLAEGYLNFFL